MSISDKINSIRTHLEDDYTALEQLGVSVEDRNIENIKDMANQIYAKFPKTDYAEGSNITLSNTLKGKLDFEDGIVGYGDTSQEGTPTPDNPQDIEVVRGKNRLLNNATTQTVNGVTFTKNDDGSVLVNGTATANIQYDLLLASENKKISAGNYYLSGCPSGGTAETYRLVIGVNGTLYREYGSGRAVTLASGVLNSYIYIQNGATVTNKLYKPMLEKGSQATSYLPYNTIEVVERGKNCFDTSLLPITQSGVTISKNENGDIVLNGTPSISSGHISFHVSDRTTLKAGTFTASVENKVTGIGIAFNGVASYNITMVDTITRKTNTTSQDFTGEYLVNVSYDVGTLTNYVLNPQLEEGSTATTYEPYQTPQTYQLSLGEYEFAGIGTYVDTIEYDVDEDKVYKNENIGKARLTGTAQTWASGVTSINEKKRYYTDGFMNVIVKPSSVSVIGDVLCNYYKPQVASSQGSYGGKQGISVDAGGRIYINDDNYQDNLDGWKTWLNGVTCELYYALQTANDIEITGTLKDQIKALYYSHSFTGTTIIEINGNLPLIIKVRALKGE